MTASLSVAILATAVAAGAAQAATATFAFTGSEQPFTVPAGVTSVQVAATGASGAAGDPNLGFSGPGGAGALVAATLPATPGQTLYVEVGGVGQCNGAGPSFMPAPAGGGGGAADVRTVSVAGALCDAQDTASLQSRLIVAAGGGGGGVGSDSANGGAGGGAAGEPGLDPDGPNNLAQPGTQTGGGAGAEGGDVDGTNGSLGQGGAGGVSYGHAWGGGGGGGLYGGGGGGTYRLTGAYVGTGGAGGSSLVPAGGSLGLASGPAQVTITYTPTDGVPRADCSHPVAGTAGGENRILTSGDDAFDGLGGNDNILGLGGNDCLLGSGGSDNLTGDAGNDTLSGGIGNDNLVGGDGLDDLTGGAGSDNVVAGAGNDVVDIFDSARGDIVVCGSGVDTVYADPGDVVGFDCENVTRAARP